MATRSSAVTQNVQRSTNKEKNSNKGQEGEFMGKSATPSTLRDVP